MPEIVGARVDSRMIHARITAQWAEALGANLLLVANDAVSRDAFRQGLMNLAAPAYAQTRYFTLDKTIHTIHQASPAQKIFLITATVEDALRLKQGGVPIEKLTLGDIPFQVGKRQISVGIYVNEREEKALKALKDLGVHLEIQRTPQSACESIPAFFETPCKE